MIWHSAYFKRAEFACKCGCGADTVDHELILLLDFLRARFDRKIKITSGCRCEKHNTAVGGKPNSKHLTGRAADIVVEGIEANEVQTYIDFLFGDRYGVGRYKTFTHIDTRSDGPVRW